MCIPPCGWCSLAGSLATQGLAPDEAPIGMVELDGELALVMDTTDFAEAFDAHYGLLAPAQTVLVRAYGDDGDDQMLAEMQPRFIVMFEPSQDFVRRVEVRARLCASGSSSRCIRCIAPGARGSRCACTLWSISLVRRNISSWLHSGGRRRRSSH